MPPNVFRGGGEISARGWKVKAQEAAVRLGGAPVRSRWKRGLRQRVSCVDASADYGAGGRIAI